MGVFFAIVGAIIIGFGWLMHLRGQAKGRRAGTWPTTQGMVLSSEVVSVPVMGNTMLTPAVSYSYAVSGQTRLGDGLRVGVPHYFNTPSKAQALADKYPVGAAVTVHYDPGAPAKTALDLAIGEGYFPLMVYSFGATLLLLGVFSAVMGV